MDETIPLPEGFEPPEEYELGRFRLEALAPKHNEPDYEAWTSSKDELQNIFGPRDGWPGEVISIEQNLQDLTKDYQEFLNRQTFRYAVLNLDGTSYDGCFYIRPTSARGYDCRIDFWFKNASKSLESQFYVAIKDWLADFWQFKRVILPGRDTSWEEYYRLTD